MTEKTSSFEQVVAHVVRTKCEPAIKAMAALASELSGQVVNTSKVQLTLPEGGPLPHPWMLSLDFSWRGPAGEFTVDAVLMADVCPFTSAPLDYVAQGNGPYPCEWIRTKATVCRVMVETVKQPRVFKSKRTYDDCVLEFAKACSRFGSKRLKWAEDYSWPGVRNWQVALRELAQ